MVGVFNILGSSLEIVSDTVVGGIVLFVANSLTPLQDIINLAISGWNTLAEAI